MEGWSERESVGGEGGGKWSKLSVNEEETEHKHERGNELSNEHDCLFWTQDLTGVLEVDWASG